MRRIREVLLNEYIGAIAIGFILAQVVAGIVSTVVTPIAFYWESRRRPANAFESRAFSWESLLVPLVSVVLYLLAAYLLVHWLYLRPVEETVEKTNGDDVSAAPDGSTQP
jgi:multisubunit Na+/H+ antiporter MnhB subunit